MVKLFTLPPLKRAVDALETPRRGHDNPHDVNMASVHHIDGTRSQMGALPF